MMPGSEATAPGNSPGCEPDSRTGNSSSIVEISDKPDNETEEKRGKNLIVGILAIMGVNLIWTFSNWLVCNKILVDWKCDYGALYLLCPSAMGLMFHLIFWAVKRRCSKKENLKPWKEQLPSLWSVCVLAGVWSLGEVWCDKAFDLAPMTVAVPCLQVTGIFTLAIALFMGWKVMNRDTWLNISGYGIVVICVVIVCVFGAANKTCAPTDPSKPAEPSHENIPMAVVWAVLSALCYAVYTSLEEHLFEEDGVDPSAVLGSIGAITAPVSAVVILFTYCFLETTAHGGFAGLPWRWILLNSSTIPFAEFCISTAVQNTSAFILTVGLAFTTPVSYVVDLAFTNGYRIAQNGGIEEGCEGLVNFSVPAVFGIVGLLIGFAVANINFNQAIFVWQKLTCKEGQDFEEKETPLAPLLEEEPSEKKEQEQGNTPETQIDREQQMS